MSSDQDALLADMLLEASGSGQTRILIAVCTTMQQKSLAERFRYLCRRDGIEISEVNASRINPDKLLTLFLDDLRRENPDVIALSQISTIDREQRINIYKALNFQRDPIMRLKVTLLIWLTTEEAFELTKNAPDLWSRRTAVYRFDDTPTQKLIAKLFANSPIPRETFAGDADLSACLHTVLEKEEQLRKHITPKSEFDVSRAKDCQTRLIAAADRLLSAAKSGKAIEIALWLWNLSDLDLVLQRWLSVLTPQDRRLFGGLYTDRNEVLLELAERLPVLIKKYRSSLARDLGRLRAASLLDYFQIEAEKYLDSIAGKLESLSEVETSSRPGNTEDEQRPIYDLESIDTELAAQNLENWLAGRIKARPRYLTQEEGELLKDLYHGRLVFEHAMQFGASERQVLLKVEALERKLRLLFGRGIRVRPQRLL